MSLAAGTRLGPYEIGSPIGVGGMGEVYRARDTKLKREVAIKVLPEAFARDAERRKRFEREAQVVASLNHPNIATLYGFEEADGRLFLVMELVEGETLEERLARGRLHVDEALPIFEQIAEGLASAHAKGIIHRDLKPANIKIRSDGTVKILDFGLAKALAGETADSVEASQSPTLTKGTALGAILGTAPYMSPEQARGKAVDKRTDIWAFGCCLYETLSGQRPFSGDTVSDTIARILQTEPELDALPAETPVALRRLLRRCLAKDPTRRVHDIADARIEIHEAGAEAPESVGAPPTARTTSLVVTAVAAALLSGAVVWWLTHSEPLPPAPVTHAVIPYPPETELRTTFTPSLAISPDGRRVAYRVTKDGQTLIYLRSLDEREGRPLAGTERGRMPFFSPDGQWLAFQGDTELMKISVTGGAPFLIAEIGNPELRGASWSSDGTIFFSGQSAGLSRVSGEGGLVEKVTVPERERGEKSHRYPHVLPGGKAVLFTLGTGDIDLFDDASIAVLSLATGDYRVVLEGGTNPHYSRTGHLVYGRRDELVAVPFDLESASVTGGSVTVLSGVTSVPIAGNVEFDLASDGTLVYAYGELSRSRRIVWIDRAGHKEAAIRDVDDFASLDVSPDGRRLATFVGRANNNIWVYELERGTVMHRIELFDNHFPSFSPRGDRMAFSSNRSGVFALYWQAADGSAPAERLTTSVYNQDVSSWSPDEKWLAFQESRPDTGWDIWLLPLDEERVPRPFLQTEFDERWAQISPDGQFLAYQSNETGRDEIYVRSFPDPSRWLQVSTTGGTHPRWNPIRGELLYLSGNEVLAVSLKGGWPNPEIGAPRVAFRVEFAAAEDSGFGFGLAPDGERIAIIENAEPSEPITDLQLVLNWSEELKRLVPISN